MDRILIVAITRLGDMLQCSPTIVGLKRKYPNAHITVLIDKQFANICSGIPGIDEAHVIDMSFCCRGIHRGNEGLVEAFSYITNTVDELREQKFDLCLNMSNSPYTALMIKMLNVPESRGWLSDEEGFRLMADPWAMLFAAFVYHTNRDYNSLNLVDIFRYAADVRDAPPKLEYNVPADMDQYVDAFLEEEGIAGGGPLICVQAGASQAKRQWAPQRFAELTRMLVEGLGARVVFTGTPSEQAIIDGILSHYSSPRVVSAIGKTNFTQLGGLLKKADLLITGDTGPMHLSVAVGTPVVAIFLASALCFETGPYSAGNFVVQPQISCNPCNPNFPCSRPDCHDQVTPQLIAQLAQLRMQTAIGNEEQISLPPELADPREVIVYYSRFDDDGFLDFLPMNGYAPRHGEPLGFYETARASYRALWKEEFAGIPFAARAKSTQADFEVVHPVLSGIHRAAELSQHGQSWLKKLVALIKDSSASADSLKEVNLALATVDNEIEQVALAYPMLSAIIRIFIMEKENMRGEDPLVLASEMNELYTRIERRCIRFGHLFEHFYRQFSQTGDSISGSALAFGQPALLEDNNKEGLVA